MYYGQSCRNTLFTEFFMSITENKAVGRIAKRRILYTAIAFFLAFVILLLNLFRLQIINYAYYTDKVYEQLTTSSKIKANRGVIYDRNMQVLATDKTVWRIFASPRQISLRTKYDSTDNSHLISTELSKIFSIPEDEIYRCWQQHPTGGSL